MYKNKIQVALLSLAFLAVGCSKEDDANDLSKFFYDIPQTDLNEDAVLGCYYQNSSIVNFWVNQIDTPLVTPSGNYTPLEEGVMSYHVEKAQQAGIDFFIFDWNEAANAMGNTIQTQLINSFLEQDSDIKLMLRWQMGHLGLNKTKQLRPLNHPDFNALALNAFLNDFNYLDETYFSKEHAQKVDGRPVVMFQILPPNQFIDWGFAADTLRGHILKNTGVEPYIVAEYPTQFSPPERYAEVFAKYDAATVSNMKPNTYDRWFGYFSFVDLNWQLWNKTFQSWGKDFIPTAWTAYYRNNESNPSAFYTVERSRKNFIDICNVAKRNRSKTNMIFMYAWNDVKLGAALEPCRGWGDEYINIAKEQFSKK